MATTLWSIVLIVILAVIAVKVWPLRRVIVFEYQRGLKYRNGRFLKTLTPGLYWIFPPTTVITPVDVRSQFVTIPGQEVISADGVTPPDRFSFLVFRFSLKTASGFNPFESL